MIDWFRIIPSKFDGTDDWKFPFGRPDEKSKEKQPQKTTNRLPMPEPDRPAINRNNATTASAQVAILGQGQVTQDALNTANSTLTHPTWGLQAIVTNGAYGLEKIQGFAETAWKVTRADMKMLMMSFSKRSTHRMPLIAG